MHTLQRFYDYSNEVQIILVLPQEHIGYWQSLCERYNFTVPHQTVSGGSTRTESVRNGLAQVPDGTFVAIHDGVRPLVSTALIARLFEQAKKTGCAIPVLPSTDTLRHISGKLLDRNSILRVQTPQVFATRQIKEAYTKTTGQIFTDDASVYENAGYELTFVDGEANNIKITTAFDLAIAQLMM